MLRPLIQRPQRLTRKQRRERGITLALVALAIFSIIALAACRLTSARCIKPARKHNELRMQQHLLQLERFRFRASPGPRHRLPTPQPGNRFAVGQPALRPRLQLRRLSRILSAARSPLRSR